MAVVPQMGEPGVFWRGADGQVYVKGSQGTNAAGAWDANTQNYWTSRMYQEIPDPMQGGTIPTSIAPTNPNGPGTGTPAPVFNQAGATNTQGTIDQMPALLASLLAAEQGKYNNAVSDFGRQREAQQGQYDTSTVTNQQNYDANFMDSIRSGIKGLGGLMSLLRGTGGGGGTAEDIARDTVGGVTANDIRGGADTQKENQGQLDTSLSTFLTDLERKRRMNEDTLENNKRAVTRDNQTKLQELFGTMAGFYGDVGNTAASNDWMSRAGALTPSIFQNSQAQVGNYDAVPVAVKAPELTAFAAPTQPSIQTAPDGQIGSGIFTMTDPRRRREQIPVGA